MTRLSLFNSPLLLGFEQFEQAIDRISKTAEGYPPYNVEQRGEHRLRITLAVPGFTEADLSVQIEDCPLVIRGKQADHQSRVYLRSEDHTCELQLLMRTSYAVFCLKQKDINPK